MMDINELLRNELRTCKESRYVVSRETGIDKAVLSRLYHGGSCGTETAGILLNYFGYSISKKPGDRTKKK